jgi:hypothetical protein
MKYKAYPNKKSTPSRMTRKRLRRDVFLSNKRLAKAARKARRLERKSLEIEQIEE